jgi:hypothetical protein
MQPFAQHLGGSRLEHACTISSLLSRPAVMRVTGYFTLMTHAGGDMAQANDANDPSAVIHREFLQFLEYFAEPSEPGNEPEDEQVDEVLPYIQRMKVR